MQVTPLFPVDTRYTHAALEFADVLFGESDTAYLRLNDMGAACDWQQLQHYGAVIVDYSYESGLSVIQAEQLAWGIEIAGIPRDRQFWIVNKTNPTAPRACASVAVDYFLLQGDAYSRSFIAPPWKDRKNLGVCLTGKLAEREGRIGLLGTLWSRGHFENLVVSTLNSVALDTEWGSEFDAAMVNNPVNRVERFEDTSPGWPAPIGLYARSRVSIILETYIRGSHFVTEKTYRPIAHSHAFVIFGAPRTTEYLRSLGYDTFSYATGKYDWVEEVADPLRVVDAYERLQKHLDSDQVAESVAHNKTRMTQLAYTEKLKLDAAVAAWFKSL